jgi:hypothetical protein
MVMCNEITARHEVVSYSTKIPNDTLLITEQQSNHVLNEFGEKGDKGEKEVG